MLDNKSLKWYEAFSGDIHKIHFEIENFAINKKLILNRAKGTFIANKNYHITGARGSGKSMLMKIIMGHITNKEGKANLQYYFKTGSVIDIWNSSTINPMHSKILYIPQTLNLDGKVETFIDQLTFKLNPLQKKDFLLYLEFFKVKLNIKSNNQLISNQTGWNAMSGGQKKRMVISIFLSLAIVQYSSMIIIDEIKGLDLDTRKLFYDLFFSNELNQMFLEYKIRPIQQEINKAQGKRKETLENFLLIIKQNHSLIRCLVNHMGVDLKKNKDLIKWRINKDSDLEEVRTIKDKTISRFLAFVEKFVTKKIALLAREKEEIDSLLEKNNDKTQRIILKHKIKVYDKQITTILHYWKALQEQVYLVESFSELLELKVLWDLCSEIKSLEKKVFDIIKKEKLKSTLVD